MGRSKAELDAMSEEDKQADILKSLEEHGQIRIDTRPALAFWGAAVDALVEQGKIETEFIDLEEQQYSFYRVTLKKEEEEKDADYGE